MDKKINYLSRDFNSIRDELIKFSKLYYPELADSFDDSSVGSWMIDLVSAVGDDLAYSIDRTFQETQLDSANMKSSLNNIARNNSIKIPGKKAALCEVELSCTLPISQDNISMPEWNLAPIVKRTTTVSNGTYNFELSEDVNFAEQFNSDGYSNRIFSPLTNSNGVTTAYTVSKSVLAYGGKSKIYSKIISEEELQPFMEIILPDTNVMNVESIIFKEADTLNEVPTNEEFYIDEEVYKFSDEDINTYRYFEVESLSDQYRFGDMTNLTDNNVIKSIYYPSIYVDYTETESSSTRTTRVYKGKWKAITQKFITEYTDNGYMKITFGANSIDSNIPDGETQYGQNMMCNIMNNPMLGIMPKAGWTMYVLYRVGGGINTNLGVNSINTISFRDASFAAYAAFSFSNTARNSVLQSLSVSNLVASLGGKDAPSSEEIKYLIKYNNGSQCRCVTLKDYRGRLLMMPPKYGCPFRNNVIEENNKIVFALLNVNENGKLTSYLPSALSDNIVEYMSHYKSLGDYIEIKSGKIYNLGFMVEVFVSKNYTTSTVINNVINSVKTYMDINSREMGEEIFIGDLEKTINLIDGVLALISLKVYNIYNNGEEGSKYGSKSTLPEYVEYDSCNNKVIDEFSVTNGECYRIDLDSLDSVLTLDYNSMFEILNPSSDIQIKVKLK